MLSLMEVLAKRLDRDSADNGAPSRPVVLVSVASTRRLRQGSRESYAASVASASASTNVPRAMSSGEAYSSGRWL
jgi:hypothetical protein